MKSSHSHDRKLHPISEYALILGAGAGAVASIAAPATGGGFYSGDNPGGPGNVEPLPPRPAH